MESVQRKWTTREIANVTHLAYVERLKVLELFSILGQLMRADLVKCWKIFHSEVNIGLLDGLTVDVDQKTRGHSFKVVVSRCELEMRRRFFHARVIINGIHYLSVVLCNLYCPPIRVNWRRNWVICGTQCCNFSPYFFSIFLLLCVFGSVMTHDQGVSIG